MGSITHTGGNKEFVHPKNHYEDMASKQTKHTKAFREAQGTERRKCDNCSKAFKELSFTCSRCQRKYCSDCRLPEYHSCSAKRARRFKKKQKIRSDLDKWPVVIDRAIHSEKWICPFCKDSRMKPYTHCSKCRIDFCEDCYLLEKHKHNLWQSFKRWLKRL